MSEELDRLAAAHGIELAYVSETGEHRVIGDETKRALLDCLGAADGTIPAARSGVPSRRCYLPDWIQQSRGWGVTVQLYGVPSSRNHGIGDFEDAARLAEMIGPLGADFLGINPIHALFSADPMRSSPYFPSSRQFLNPLYIALDKVPSAADTLAAFPDDDITALRSDPHVDYSRVAALKLRVLAEAFSCAADDDEFVAYCVKEGPALERFATFEALSEALFRQGHGAGWHAWPEAYRLAGLLQMWKPFVEPMQSAFASINGCNGSRRVSLLTRSAVREQRACGSGSISTLQSALRQTAPRHWCDPEAYAAGRPHRRAARLVQPRGSGLGTGAIQAVVSRGC